ncbi:MAG: sigma-70 family RNA polymerase sigma factor [Chitinophagales bacterium]
MEKNQHSNSIRVGSVAWIAEIKKGNSQLIQDLYKTYKKEFVVWIQGQTNCSEDFSVDVFQDSVVALYENIKKGKIVAFNKSVKHYLFGIGRKVYYMHLRKYKMELAKTVSFEENGLDLDTLKVEVVPNEFDEKNTMLSLLLKMKEPCKSILYLYYYKEMRINEVAERLKYKNENVVRVQKGRCMNALRKVYNKNKDS